MIKKVQKEKDNTERWMLSYLDFITLLMIFFLVMYAISAVDQKKYEQLAVSLQEGFHVITGNGEVMEGPGGTGIEKNMGNGDGVLTGKGSGLAAGDETEKKEDTKAAVPKEDTEGTVKDGVSAARQEAEVLKGVKSQVDQLLTQAGLQSSVTTSIQERGLVISFNSNLFFDSGKAEIKYDWQQQLTAIAQVLNGLGNYIRVEGHTDNVSISTSQYSSNWQLSAARAANVVEFLIDQGGIKPERLSAIGYGEYRPTAANDSEAGKAANRRVDILILNSRYNDSESRQNP